MKIVMFMMEGHGGTFQYGALLCNALSKRHCVTAIIPRRAKKEFFVRSVKVMEFPMGDNVTNSIVNTLIASRIAQVLKAIKREHPDVIHFHHPYYPWACLLLPWLGSYPIVSSLPEGKLHQGMNKRLEIIMSRKIHIIFSDAIIVLCKHDKEFILTDAKNKKIFVIPHGENVLFTGYAKQNIQEKDAILFFGGIAPFKGLEYLLKAFHLVRKKVPSTELLIAGRGSLNNYHGLICGLGNNIKVDNQFIPPQKVAEYFQQSKIVVLPYIEHDHPGVVPIAYSFGKPVIATQLVSEVVEHRKTGLVVPAKNEVALAEAIIELLEDETLRKKMGDYAHMKARQELDWIKIADEVAEVYKTVSAEKL